MLNVGKSHKPNSSVDIHDFTHALRTSTHSALTASCAVNSLALPCNVKCYILPLNSDCITASHYSNTALYCITASHYSNTTLYCITASHYSNTALYCITASHYSNTALYCITASHYSNTALYSQSLTIIFVLLRPNAVTTATQIYVSAILLLLIDGK